MEGIEIKWEYGIASQDLINDLKDGPKIIKTPSGFELVIKNKKPNYPTSKDVLYARFPTYDKALKAKKNMWFIGLKKEKKMAKRVETYIHSDSVTSNKGGCMVAVYCDTDFAAKTEGFVNICKKIAMLSYSVFAGTCHLSCPNDIRQTLSDNYPDFKEEIDNLEKELKEKIIIAHLSIL